jgi:thiamine-monophosphate kinase
METVMTGGDDFEVIATVAPGRVDNLRREAAAAGVTVTPIGVIAAGEGARFRDRDGRVLAFQQPSYSHF